jgi:hypothetical protein
MMDGGVVIPDLRLSLAALDRVMPMHLCLDPAGRVTTAGPTLAKLFPDQALIGRDLFDLFVLRRTGPIVSMDAVQARLGQLLTLTQRQGAIALRGIALPLADGRGVLMNLSFGNAVLGAVRTYGLTNADFAPNCRR